MTQTTLGKYLVQRIEQLGVQHVFGIPGDYVLGFYDLLVESSMQIIGTCDEQGAGFAADAYARVNGLGCLAATYYVGGLKTLNPVAGGMPLRQVITSRHNARYNHLRIDKLPAKMLLCFATF